MVIILYVLVNLINLIIILKNDKNGARTSYVSSEMRFSGFSGFSGALARPYLASDFHISLSIIHFRSSSSSHSQPCFSVSINDFDCLPLVRVPCFGVHSITLCATSYEEVAHILYIYIYFIRLYFFIIFSLYIPAE